jgi:ribosome maturation factor RimP
MTAKQEATQTVQALIQSVLDPIGLDLVSVEYLTGREKKLRVFIERKDRKPIGMEDCVSATKALDAPLEASPEIEALYPASYELEVSSPGVERPLSRPADYERFQGERVRIHTFRPLTGSELREELFASKNPKQKNFIGTLEGLENATAVWLSLEGGPRVTIPFPLITKAHLEPRFEKEGHET